MNNPALIAAVPARQNAWHAGMDTFLYDEAALLDEWRLKEWLQLIDPSCRYLVPSLDTPEADYRESLFLISDDYQSLSSRVGQLLGQSVWAERPRSRTRRMVSCVRVVDADDEVATVHANFAVWRFQHEATDVYVGQYRHIIARTANGFRFRERKAVLDLESLRPHGKLSFIL